MEEVNGDAGLEQRGQLAKRQGQILGPHPSEKSEARQPLPDRAALFMDLRGMDPLIPQLAPGRAGRLGIDNPPDHLPRIVQSLISEDRHRYLKDKDKF